MEHYDFSGWATKNDLKCSDGRRIRRNAFQHCDGKKVPLVYNHEHNSPAAVLGHCLLENREEGVYTYASFNDTPEGQRAKTLVQHGDITSLSIYANQLRQEGCDVVHGVIREVSLVLAGANPGAWIDNVLSHADSMYDEDEGQFYTNDEIELQHSEDSIELSEETEEESEGGEMEHSDETKDKEEKPSESEKTVQDVIDSMNDEQKKVTAFLVAEAAKGAKKPEKDEESEGGKEMSHNLFEGETPENTLQHDCLAVIIKDGKRFGSLKESYLAHAQEYGIENIDWLFPDAKNITEKPGFVKRNPDQWVSVVMNGVHHTPFSRIKMLFADLREDDARAKGYAKKGQLKKEEVFGLLKRTITPTTIYKKQKLDRDDIIDISDFDVVAWLKGEMRMMLDEEIARAIVFGDGRSASDPDKISESNIIPVAKDAALYTIHQTIAAGAKPEDLIDAAVIGQNDYEGSGNTTMFVATDVVTQMLLVKDTNKHRIYKDVADLALACSVNRIVKVPASIIPAGIKAVIVDLNDYNVGADKGGAVNMFDDFDIDYNQEKYLIETRCSGGLTKPFSAVVIEETQAAG